MPYRWFTVIELIFEQGRNLPKYEIDLSNIFIDWNIYLPPKLLLRDGKLITSSVNVPKRRYHNERGFP